LDEVAAEYMKDSGGLFHRIFSEFHPLLAAAGEQILIHTVAFSPVDKAQWKSRKPFQRFFWAGQQELLRGKTVETAPNFEILRHHRAKAPV